MTRRTCWMGMDRCETRIRGTKRCQKHRAREAKQSYHRLTKRTKEKNRNILGIVMSIDMSTNRPWTLRECAGLRRSHTISFLYWHRKFHRGRWSSVPTVLCLPKIVASKISPPSRWTNTSEALAFAPLALISHKPCHYVRYPPSRIHLCDSHSFC